MGQNRHLCLVDGQVQTEVEDDHQDIQATVLHMPQPGGHFRRSCFRSALGRQTLCGGGGFKRQGPSCRASEELYLC